MVVASLAVFVLLGSLSLILAAVGVRVVPEAATSSHGVTLLKAPRHAATISLPATARPVAPGQAPAARPEVSSAKETVLVAAEDARIRAVMHGAEHIAKPEVIPYQGARPTLVLPDGSRAYTAADLVHYGALVMLSGTTGLLTDNVFVASDAELDLGSATPGSATLGTLYLDSTSSGSASIVTWGGGLFFTGTAARPLTVEGWDQTASSAAADRGAGRPYIRDIGGVMTLTDVRAAALGFWSGRTGGVAWTGVTGAASRGRATGSTFTGDTYGAFVARGQGVTFTADRFESNELDGLHIHRYSVGSRVTSSSAVRNGGNGFQIDRDTQNTVLRGDLSQHNGVNGYYVDGRPLVAGASASGGSAVPSTGTVLENSAATGNARTGILIEGGSGTLVKSDEVCAAITAIALRTGVTDAILTGNDIGCHPRSALSVGPSAPGTVISGNTLSGARLGIVVRDSGRVTVDNNLVTGATVFGLTARGAGLHHQRGRQRHLRYRGPRRRHPGRGQHPRPDPDRHLGLGPPRPRHVLFLPGVPPAGRVVARHRGPDPGRRGLVLPAPAARPPVPGQHPLARAGPGRRGIGPGRGRGPGPPVPGLLLAPAGGRPAAATGLPARAGLPAGTGHAARAGLPAGTGHAAQPAVARPQPAQPQVAQPQPALTRPQRVVSPPTTRVHPAPARRPAIPGRGHPAAAGGQPAARGRPATPARGDPAAAGRAVAARHPAVGRAPTTTTTSGCDRAAPLAPTVPPGPGPRRRRPTDAQATPFARPAGGGRGHEPPRPHHGRLR